VSYPPGHSITVSDGGLSLLANATALPLIVGVASGGVADTLYQYSDANALKEELGEGPAVELAVPIVEDVGACMVLKTAATTAGAAGSVTKTAVGSSTGTVTVAGAAYDGYRVVVEITSSGTVGAGRFRFSLDGGYTYSPELTIPSGGTYAIANTNLTLTFVPGDGATFFEDGDTHSFACTAPLYTTTDLSASITALLDQIGQRDIKQVFFAGKHASGSDAATMAAAIDTHMTTLASAGYFARAVMDAGADTAANVRTAFASFASNRVAPVFGDVDIIGKNTFMGWGVPRHPAMNAVAERAARAEISENLGRKMSGTLRGVRAITHDERTDQQFGETERLITLTTYRGQPGFFVTNGYLKSAPGSDFLYYDYGRLIDVVCSTADAALDKWILAKLRALADGTGRLEPKDAGRVEDAVNAALKQAVDKRTIDGLPSHVSGIRYTVNRENDFLATRNLDGAIAVVPNAPAENITTTIGLTRSIG